MNQTYLVQIIKLGRIGINGHTMWKEWDLTTYLHIYSEVLLDAPNYTAQINLFLRKGELIWKPKPLTRVVWTTAVYLHDGVQTSALKFRLRNVLIMRSEDAEVISHIALQTVGKYTSLFTTNIMHVRKLYTTVMVA